MSLKEITIDLVGSIFLGLGIISIISAIVFLDTGVASILWLSYIGLSIIAIGMIKRDAGLIASQLCILTIPYILWNIDFFYYLINKETLFGITDYFFQSGPLITKIVSSQHIFNIPISLFMIYLIGLKESKFWKISMFQIILIFFITRWTTTYSENVNCVYYNCANFDFGLYYPLQWFISFAIMIFLTYLIIKKIFLKKEIKKRKRKNK